MKPRISAEARAELQAAIRRARGLLAPKREGKPFAEEWDAHKKQEKAAEEARIARRCS